MLYVHAEDGKRLSDRVDRMSQERRPRREQVRVRRAVLEVRGEGECSQGGEDALMPVISHRPVLLKKGKREKPTIAIQI
jgi:hypothetical protein